MFTMVGLLHPDEAVLLVIDIQEKFKPVLFNGETVVASTRRMIEGCTALQVPILVTEHYPQGLGQIIPELTAVLNGAPIVEKVSFGCCGEPNFMDALKQTGRKTVLVTGNETHICVEQTVVELLNQGYEVHVLEDAVGSRHKANHKTGLKKMYQLGAIPSCTEMALFELMRTAKHPEFKVIQKLVK